MLSRFLAVFLIAFVLAPVFAFSGDNAEDSLARRLLSQALENQYRGRFQASLEMNDDSFRNGGDSLSGRLEFADEEGERTIRLAGSDRAFEYRSSNYGREQWLKDDGTQRVRRIANRQCKKNAFGTLFTYEDLVKFPTDFFLDYAACEGFKTTDDGYEINMTVNPASQSFYSRLEVVLGKSPLLLRKITYYGPQGRRLKTLEVNGYEQAEGKWVADHLTMYDADSTCAVSVRLREITVPEKTAGLPPKSQVATARQPLSKWIERSRGLEEDEAEIPEDASN